MTFVWLPQLELMAELYRLPMGPGRFQAYLNALQGDTSGDMQRPVGGYNPMAKPHVLEQIEALLAMDADSIGQEVARELSQEYSSEAKEATLGIGLTLADDLMGGWTNRYTTEYDNKFKLNALVNRGFSAPYLWTSEVHSTEVLRSRIKEYAHRTAYWRLKGRPRTLPEFFDQEVYVAQRENWWRGATEPDGMVEKLLQEFGDEDEYSLLFNFFFGDAASEALGYATYGVGEFTGFAMAALRAR